MKVFYMLMMKMFLIFNFLSMSMCNNEMYDIIFENMVEIFDSC